MARKLPWASKATPTPAPTNAVPKTRAPPAKRRKTSPSTDDGNITSPDELDSNRKSKSTRTAQTSNQEHERDRGRGRGRGRTPSTSPPPAPPDVEFMHEGIDADDGYMIVEDEFHDIAKTFTAHLHHAEYKRLMKEARERKQTQRAGDVNGSIDEIRRRNVAKTLRLEGNEEPKDEAEAEDSSNEVITREEQRVGDPWAGTTLAGLMRYEPGRDRLSLKGLQGVHSGSRAAMGFGPSVDVNARTSHVDVSSKSSRSRNPEMEGLPFPTPIKKERKDGKTGERRSSLAPTRNDNPRLRHNSAIVLDDTSDDLNTASIPRLKNSNKRNVMKEKNELDDTTTTTITRPAIKSEKTIKGEEPQQHPKKPYRPVRKFIDDLDDFDDTLFDKNKDNDDGIALAAGSGNIETRSPRGMHRPRTKEVKVKIKKERVDNGCGNDDDAAAIRSRLSDRLDEVPVFLA